MITKSPRAICVPVLAFISISIIWAVSRLWTLDDAAASVSRPYKEDEAVPETAPSPSIVGQREVIGVVFYGRRDFVRILDCYLKVSHSLLYPCSLSDPQ